MSLGAGLRRSGDVMLHSLKLASTGNLVIGVSLSKPHTSETDCIARVCVYLSMLVCLWPYTVNFK